MDHGVTHLYRRIISPSLKNNSCEPNGWHHYRHSNMAPSYPGKNRLKAGSPDGKRGATPHAHLEQQIVHVPCSELVSGDVASRGASPINDGSYSFQPTTTFRTTTLPAMPLSRMYSPSPTGTTRSVPVTVAHQKPSTPQRAWTNENPRLLFSSQHERLEIEEQAKEHCRKLKRTSEIRSHRIDKGYYISGSQIPITSRYRVDPNDLLRLRFLARQRQSSAQNTVTDYQSVRDVDLSSGNPRESPGGQLSSPVPSQRATSSAAFSSATDFGEVSSQDGKWAHDNSESSSVLDENDMDSLRRSLKEKGRLQALQKKTAAGRKLSSDSQSELSVKGTPTGENSGREGKDGSEKGGSEKDGSEKDGSKEITDGSANETVENVKTAKQSKPIKKIPKIRFQDGPKTLGQGTKVKRQVRKNREEEKKEKKYDKKDEKEEQGEKKPNRFMDEWLGIKREPVDERYKPGKPKPNRIFLSSELTNREKKSGKFSEVFLSELEVPDDADIEDDYLILNPDKKYCFLNEKQKVAFGGMFDEIDKDKNGSVTLEELKMRMVPAVSKSDIKHFVQVFDLNKDLTIDKREFTAICALNDKLSGISTESEDSSLALNLGTLAQHIVIYKEMYKTMDEDDDNRLDADEVMIMVATAMSTSLGADLELARKVVDGARDEHGYIDFIGFLLYMPFFAKLYKAIMETPLTIEELEKAKERVRQKEIAFKPKIERPKKEPKSWEVF